MIKRLLAAVVLGACVFGASGQVRLEIDGLVPEYRSGVERAIGLASDAAAALWGIDPAEVDARFVLHPTHAAYEEADQVLNAGRFRANGAFATAGQAHVLIQPPVSDAALAELGVPAQTLRLVAHETAHLVRGALPNRAGHPKWLVDGTAQLVAERVARAMELAPPRGEDPWTATQIVRLRRARDEGRLPSVSDLFSDSDAGLTASERYASRWALAAWLDEAGALAPLLADARRFGGGSGYGAQVAASAMDAARGVADDPDRAWHAWLDARPAAWDEVYRSLTITPDRWVQAAFPASNAIAWTTPDQPSETYTLAGEVLIVPGDRQQMNLLLARSGDGFVSVALTAGWGVTVFRYHARGDRWERLASAETPALSAGRWVDFVVRARDGRVAVEVDGAPVVEAVSPAPLRGAWGVGAQSGSAGCWRGVAFEPAPPSGAP